MARNKDMKRLLLDGKPVGFQLTTVLTNGRCQAYYSLELKPYATIQDIFKNWCPESMDSFEYNSFELCKEFRGIHFFEGDIIHSDFFGSDAEIMQDFELSWSKGNVGRPTHLWDIVNGVVIGNIHKEG